MIKIQNLEVFPLNYWHCSIIQRNFIWIHFNLTFWQLYKIAPTFKSYWQKLTVFRIIFFFNFYIKAFRFKTLSIFIRKMPENELQRHVLTSRNFCIFFREHGHLAYQTKALSSRKFIKNEKLTFGGYLKSRRGQQAQKWPTAKYTTVDFLCRVCLAL